MQHIYNQGWDGAIDDVCTMENMEVGRDFVAACAHGEEKNKLVAIGPKYKERLLNQN